MVECMLCTHKVIGSIPIISKLVRKVNLLWFFYELSSGWSWTNDLVVNSHSLYLWATEDRSRSIINKKVVVEDTQILPVLIVTMVFNQKLSILTIYFIFYKIEEMN